MTDALQGLRHLIEKVFLAAADLYAAAVPRPPVDRRRAATCRIVSHRGEHGKAGVIENTLAAFERARAAGVWGIECDVRWTGDLQPVVFHDPDLQRIFGDPRKVADLTRDQLQRDFPFIPSLAEVVRRFGGRLHLMVELKAEPYPKPALQSDRLARCLAGLRSGVDYHFISLDPAMFDFVGFVPAAALVPVSQLNSRRLSRTALSTGLGGVAGHYLFMTRAMIDRHHAAGQKVGTGYIRSRNSLRRELNRGVDWIFSNHAAWLQGVLHREKNR